MRGATAYRLPPPSARSTASLVPGSVGSCPSFEGSAHITAAASLPGFGVPLISRPRNTVSA